MSRQSIREPIKQENSEVPIFHLVSCSLIAYNVTLTGLDLILVVFDISFVGNDSYCIV